MGDAILFLCAGLLWGSAAAVLAFHRVFLGQIIYEKIKPMTAVLWIIWLVVMVAIVAGPFISALTTTPGNCLVCGASGHNWHDCPECE